MIIQNETFFQINEVFPESFLFETKKLWEPLLGHSLTLAEARDLIKKSLDLVDWFVQWQDSL